MRRLVPTLLCLILLAAAAPLAAQSAGETERLAVPFSDPSQPGRLEIGLLAGSITVEAYDGAEAIFEISPRGVDDSEQPRQTEDGMLVIPNRSFSFSVEEEGNVMEMDSDSWHRALDVVVRVPRATSLELGTVNQGDIEVRGVAGDHELSNTNGSITATGIAGSVVAETVNGGITVELTRLAEAKPMAFATLNGTIDVTLPATTAADLVLDAGNGSITSDFEIALERMPPKIEKGRDGGRYRVEVENEVRGAINGGGQEMRFETFNGSIVIRKGG